MKTIKTADATGAALDWLVCKALGHYLPPFDEYTLGWLGTKNFSTDWSQGGPIVEREGISLIRQTETRWVSEYSNGCSRSDHGRSWGPTPLIAAMRCFVASKLGDTAEVPEELL